MPSHDIQLIPIPMWVYELESLRFLDVNDAALFHYGYTREEFMALSLLDIRPPDDRALLKEAIESLKYHRASFHKRQYRHQKKNGEIMFVEITGTVQEVNGTLIEVVAIHDITQLILNRQMTNEIQARLQSRERRFKLMLQEGSDIVSIVDFKGNFAFVSDNTLAILGFSPEELCGTNAFDYIHPADKERIWNHLQQLQQEKRVAAAPFRFQNHKKQWRWISTTFTNMMDDDAVRGIVTNSKDITESILKKKELAKRNRELKEIAWAQSHQVRAPLSRAIALIDLLEREDELKPSQKELLKHLSDSATELDVMIRGIVQKIEARHKQITRR